VEVQVLLVRKHERAIVGVDVEDVPARPDLEEVERVVDVRVEERLERHKPLLDLLGRGPAPGALAGGPGVEILLHRVHRRERGVGRDVPDVVEQVLGLEAEDFGQQNLRARP
jgi:hypothetical protein